VQVCSKRLSVLSKAYVYGMAWTINFDWNITMIVEWIVAGFFTYFGWWGAGKVIDNYVEYPKPVQAICIEKKEEQCGVKDK